MDELVKVDEFLYRARFKTEADVVKWLHAYEVESATSWRVKSTLKNSVRFIYRKTFICHHGGFHRVKKEENKKGKSKNTQCRAELVITIKKVTKDTRKKDAHVKAGYPTIIQLKNEHNHTLKTAEAGSFLRPRDEIRSCYESYFNDGMSLKESINYHESKLKLQFGLDSMEFANARNNPQYRTVLYWYTEWRKLNLGPRFGSSSIKVVAALKDDSISSRIQEEEIVNDFKEERDEVLDNLFDPLGTASIDSSTLILTDERPSQSVQSSKRVKREVSPEVSEMIVDTLEESNTIMTEANSTKEDKEDSFDLFGRYIAAQLRSLPRRESILLQQEIQNCVTTTLLTLCPTDQIKVETE